MIPQATAIPEDLQHGTPRQLEGYVMGLLDPREQRWLEAHVSGCLLCARALATEARRELALTAAITTTMARASAADRGRAGRPRRYHAPLLAMAAALALVASLGRQRTGVDPFSVVPGTAAEQSAALAASHQPLLACLLDGEEALCAAPAGSSGVSGFGRSAERASRLHTAIAAVDTTGGLCRASDGTCSLQSRRD